MGAAEDPPLRRDAARLAGPVKKKTPTYAEKVGSPKLQVGPASGVRVDPGVIDRLVALVAKMKTDPYVMGMPSVASAARACMLVGLEHLELRYGIKVENPSNPPRIGEAAE